MKCFLSYTAIYCWKEVKPDYLTPHSVKYNFKSVKFACNIP